MNKNGSIKDKFNLSAELKVYDLYVILDAVYQRRLEAKMKIEKMEEGIKESSEYEFWKKIYNDCDQVFIKIINFVNYINENLKLKV